MAGSHILVTRKLQNIYLRCSCAIICAGLGDTGCVGNWGMGVVEVETLVTLLGCKGRAVEVADLLGVAGALLRIWSRWFWKAVLEQK